MKNLALIVALVSISFCLSAQDVVLLKNDSVYIGNLTSGEYYLKTNNSFQSQQIKKQIEANPELKNKYLKYTLITENQTYVFNQTDIKYFVKNYQSISRAVYFAKATRLYNTSTVFGILGFSSATLGAMNSNDGLIYAGIGCTLVAFICQISANQQFKNVAELIEIELAANKIGLNIRF